MNRSLQGRRSGVVVDLCCGHERRQNSPQRELEAAQQRHRQSSPLEGLLRRLARQLL
jgi:hypothetical protein